MWGGGGAVHRLTLYTLFPIFSEGRGASVHRLWDEVVRACRVRFEIRQWNGFDFWFISIHSCDTKKSRIQCQFVVHNPYMFLQERMTFSLGFCQENVLAIKAELSGLGWGLNLCFRPLSFYF